MKLKFIIANFIISLISLSSLKKFDLTDLDKALENEDLFSPLYNMTVEWGIYKPDLYFGVKNR